MFDCVHPCTCGYFGDNLKPCTCAPAMVTKYQKRISGPMLDRMDIHIEVPSVDYEKLSSDRLGESSVGIRARVESARARQRVRFAEAVNVVSNSDMRVTEVRQPQVQVGRDQRKSRARRDIVLCMSRLSARADAQHCVIAF